MLFLLVLIFLKNDVFSSILESQVNLCYQGRVLFLVLALPENSKIDPEFPGFIIQNIPEYKEFLYFGDRH